MEIAKAVDNGQCINVSVRKPSIRYLDEFIRLKCAGDLLNEKLFPNAKEISESMAAYSAVRHIVYQSDGAVKFSDRGIMLYAVGDGVSPRTGALFAYRSAWHCVSIDPKLRSPGCADRLHKLNRGIEDFMQAQIPDIAIIVCVHSHAKLNRCLQSIKAKTLRIVVAIPCCVPQDIYGPGEQKIAPDVEYEDWGILSPKRTVKIWEGV